MYFDSCENSLPVDTIEHCETTLKSTTLLPRRSLTFDNLFLIVFVPKNGYRYVSSFCGMAAFQSKCVIMYQACTYTQIIDLYTMQKTFIHHAIHYSGVYTLYKTYTMCKILYTVHEPIHLSAWNYTLQTVQGPIHCLNIIQELIHCAWTYTIFRGSKHCAGTYSLCSDLYTLQWSITIHCVEVLYIHCAWTYTLCSDLFTVYGPIHCAWIYILCRELNIMQGSILCASWT